MLTMLSGPMLGKKPSEADDTRWFRLPARSDVVMANSPYILTTPIIATNVEQLSKEDQELLSAVKSGKKKVVDNSNDDDGDEMSAEDRQMTSDIKSGKKKVVDAGENLDALSREDRDTLTAIQTGKKKV